ncbi:MAG: hypothetical protein RSD62_08180 [Ruthenibacterium sp.]
MKMQPNTGAAKPLETRAPKRGEPAEQASETTPSKPFFSAEATSTERLSAGHFARRAAAFARDLLLPRRCPYCGGVVGFASCTLCPPQLPHVTRAQGTPVPKRGHTLCNLRCVYAPFWYAEPVRRAIWHMKFSGALHQVSFYAQKMAQALCAADSADYDMLVFVPTTRREHRRRDNIPRLLARELSRELNVPVGKKMLCKTRETQRQMSLSGTERLENVRDAYKVLCPQAVQGCRVLLVDDVVTTGATLNECAKALLCAGAVACDGVCIAASEKF